jgi:hypothetical protein
MNMLSLLLLRPVHGHCTLVACGGWLGLHRGDQAAAMACHGDMIGVFHVMVAGASCLNRVLHAHAASHELALNAATVPFP